MTYDDLHTQALALKGDWSITTDEWHWLAAITNRLGAKRVLEFGPGYSTLAFVAGGATEVATHECNPAYYNKFLSAMERTKHHDCVYSMRFDAGKLSLGDIDQHPDTTPSDLAFVDAPAGSACYYSRLSTVLCALDCAKTVILHDTSRIGEQRTLEVVSRLGVELIERRVEDMGMVVMRRTSQ